MSAIVVLGASVLQRPLILAAKATGERVVTVDNVPDNVGHRCADASYDVSTRDVDGVIEVARLEGASAVLTCCSDVALPAAAAACASLGLPGVEPKILELWHPKSNLRAFQSEFGLPHPAYVSGPVSASFLNRARALEGELIVKPSDRSGSRGVAHVSGVDDPAFLAAVDAAAELSFSGEIVIEAFVEGVEFGGDAWVRDGRIDALFATRKDMQDTIVRGHVLPAALSDTEHAALSAVLEGHVRHAGYPSGPLNFDVRFDREGMPILIELAPRLGGNWIPQLIHWSSGVDLFEATIEDALGRPAAVETTRSRRGASFVIGCGDTRVLAEEIPIDAIKAAVANLVELEIDFGRGDPIEVLRDSGQQVGRALFDLESDSLASTAARLEQALTPWLAATRPPITQESPH